MISDERIREIEEGHVLSYSSAEADMRIYRQIAAESAEARTEEIAVDLEETARDLRDSGYTVAASTYEDAVDEVRALPVKGGE